MRRILLTGLFTALALPAFAKDSGDAAFYLLSQYMAEKSRPNYIKLQSSIDMADAMAIDAKISKIYGAPEISRDGLKVWEVENTTGKGGRTTTIMCGPDGNGGIFISADRRGKAMNRLPKGSEKKAESKSRPPKKTKVKRKMNRQERD